MPKTGAKKPKIGASVVVGNPDGSNEHLVIAETEEHKYLTVNFPGGKKKKRETIGRCAARECLEEAKVEVEVTHVIAIHERPDRSIHVTLAATAIGGSPEHSNEHPWAGYYPDEELEKMQQEGDTRWPTMISDIEKSRRGDMMPIEEFYQAVTCIGIIALGEMTDELQGQEQIRIAA